MLLWTQPASQCYSIYLSLLREPGVHSCMPLPGDLAAPTEYCGSVPSCGVHEVVATQCQQRGRPGGPLLPTLLPKTKAHTVPAPGSCSKMVLSGPTGVALFTALEYPVLPLPHLLFLLLKSEFQPQLG